MRRVQFVLLPFVLLLTATADDHDWGMPLMLLAPETVGEFSPISDLRPPVMDDTGRLWKIVVGSSYSMRHLLITWENDAWLPVNLVPLEMMQNIPVPLYLGPEGRAVFGWQDKDRNIVFTELYGMRYRHAPPPRLPVGELRLYEDSRGHPWVDIGVQYKTHGLLPRPEELTHIVTVPLSNRQFIHPSVDRPVKVISDGSGRYAFSGTKFYGTRGESFRTPVLLNTQEDWTEDVEEPSRQLSFRAPFHVLTQDGELLPGSERWVGYDAQESMTVFLGPKDDRTFWLAVAMVLWEVEWNTLNCRIWFGEHEAPGTYNSFFGRDILDICPIGDRWLLSTERGGYFIETQQEIMAIPNRAWLAAGHNGLWALTENVVAGASLAFLPEGGDAFRWLGRPKGISADNARNIWMSSDGILRIEYPNRVIDFSAEELQRLADASSVGPDAARCRLFKYTSEVIAMPDGRACIFSNPRSHSGVIGILDNGGWKLSAPQVANWQWCLVDDQNKVWLLRFHKPYKWEAKEPHIRWMRYDPTNGTVDQGESFFDALADIAANVEQFTGVSTERRIPLLGQDGSGVLMVESCLFIREANVWQSPIPSHEAFLPAVPMRDDVPHLDSPFYYNEQDMICVEADGRIYMFVPEMRAFIHAPQEASLEVAASARHAPHRPFEAPPTHARATFFGRDHEAPQLQNSHIYRGVDYSNRFLDHLGISWIWREDALIREGHGLSRVMLRGAEVDPLRGGIVVSAISYDRWGGAFIYLYGNMLAHIRGTDPPPETRVEAEARENRRVSLRFNSESGLRHAWRFEGGVWQHTDAAEIIIGPLSPGENVIEVYAFDDELNVDPIPKRLYKSVSMLPQEEVLTVIASGDSAHMQSLIERLESYGEAGMEMVRMLLEEAQDARTRWQLEALMHQLTLR